MGVFVISTVHAVDLAPLGVRTYAIRAMTEYPFRIHTPTDGGCARGIRLLSYTTMAPVFENNAAKTISHYRQGSIEMWFCTDYQHLTSHERHVAYFTQEVNRTMMIALIKLTQYFVKIKLHCMYHLNCSLSHGNNIIGQHCTAPPRVINMLSFAGFITAQLALIYTRDNGQTTGIGREI